MYLYGPICHYRSYTYKCQYMVLYCVHSRLLRNPSHTARCSTGVRASSLTFALPCSALPIISYHGSFMFIQRYKGQHEPIKAINGLVPSSLASEESQSGHVWGPACCFVTQLQKPPPLPWPVSPVLASSSRQRVKR